MKILIQVKVLLWFKESYVTSWAGHSNLCHHKLISKVIGQQHLTGWQEHCMEKSIAAKEKISQTI